MSYPQDLILLVKNEREVLIFDFKIAGKVIKTIDKEQTKQLCILDNPKMHLATYIRVSLR